MNTLRIRSAVLVAASLFVLSLACAAQVSLADVARRSRPLVQTSKRVFTNEDVRTAPEPEPAAPEKNDPAKLDADKAGADNTDNPKAGAADGKVTDSVTRAEIERIQKAEAVLEQKLQNIKEKLASEPDEFRRRMWADALDNQRITLDQYKKLREQLERNEQQSSKAGA
jgi:hypothetical protein